MAIVGLCRRHAAPSGRGPPFHRSVNHLHDSSTHGIDVDGFTIHDINMTTRQANKLSALRAEAEAHGDNKTIALVDAALAGDAAAAAKLGIAAKATRAVSTGVAARAPRARRSGWAAPAARDHHPFAHDEE